MRRRIFLASVLGLFALWGAGRAHASAPQDVPPDRVTLEEFKQLYAAGRVLVLDVRSGPDRKIKGAALVPLDQLESRLADLPRDREIVTYCS